MCVCPVVASGIANISQTFRKKRRFIEIKQRVHLIFGLVLAIS